MVRIGVELGYLDDIDKLEAENARLLAALKGIAEYCSGDDRTLGAIERLVSIRNTAERAVRASEQSVRTVEKS